MAGKFVVTGAAGFVGSKIAARLLTEYPESTVIGIDSMTDYYERDLKLANLEKLITNRRFSMYEKDLSYDFDLDPILHNARAVFHQAGQPGVRKSWGSDFDVYTRDNITATQRLLESAVRVSSVQAFIYASSSSVYGDAETYPTSEAVKPAPRSPYGVTKLAGEHLCNVYASNFGLHTVALRYFTVFGPGQRPDMAFTRFCKGASTGQEISLFGTGEQRRDFTYIDDVVSANIRAALCDLTPGTVMNISGGTNSSVNEVLEELSAISGCELNIVRNAAARGDVMRTSGDCSQAQTLLGWTPTVSLREGLRKQYEWIQNCGINASATDSSAIR